MDYGNMNDAEYLQHLEDKSLGRATSVLNILKAELACRQDNYHVGTGLGGNAGEFFFLVTNKVTPIISYTDPNKVGWFLTKDGGIQVRFAPKKKGQTRNFLSIRKQLTQFIKQEYSGHNLENVDFYNLMPMISAAENTTLDVYLLKQALKMTASFARDLEHTGKLLSAMKELKSKEEKDLQTSFCQALGVEFSSFEKEGSPLPSMMKSHPTFGSISNNIDKRFNDMENLLLSETDIVNIKTITSFPAYIIVLCTRTQIGLEKLIKFNLDKVANFNPLLKFEKEDDDDYTLIETLSE